MNFELVLSSLIETVEEMVNVYCRTFGTDFRLKCTAPISIGSANFVASTRMGAFSIYWLLVIS